MEFSAESEVPDIVNTTSAEFRNPQKWRVCHWQMDGVRAYKKIAAKLA